ncbi:hypothetical protein [Promicromonospora sp. NPDC057488]|uniref:hypothetical protein n=1 Tax=Promicromonospora sp. NPDC057488 TaxID=3346147 RepID=UPI003671ED0C
MLLITGAGVAPAEAEVHEGTVTASKGSYEVTARVVVSDRSTITPYEVPVDIYLEHNGTAIYFHDGWVQVTDPAGREVYTGDGTPQEVGDGHLRAIRRLGNGAPIGEYKVSFKALVTVYGAHGPSDVPIQATDVVAFQVRYHSAMEATARSGSLPTGAVTTVAGSLRWNSRDSAGDYDPVAATGAVVDIAFDPSGPAPRRVVGSANVSDTGYFRLDSRVTEPGRWYVSYAGNTVQHPASVRISQTARPSDLTVRQGTATRTSGDAKAGIRVTATDVVTTLEPQTVRVDFGVTTYGSVLSTYGVQVEGRRGEGSYPNGRYYAPRNTRMGGGTAGYIAITMDELTPPGVYDVDAGLVVAACTKSETASGSCGMKEVPINDDSVTTFTVKRATITTISASSKSLATPQSVTLKGSVRKLQLVSNREAAYRHSPKAPVKLYWDPAGSAAPQYKKTVYTNSKGVWAAKVTTSASGRWVAEFPGTSLHASSSRTVWITVK